MSHRTGAIIIEIPNESRKVNCIECGCKITMLDVDYWVHDGKVYKKTPDGKFRELVRQTKKATYNHYFFRSKEDKKKLTLNVNRLDRLTFEPAPSKNDEIVWVKS
jgi:hypothetical protein